LKSADPSVGLTPIESLALATLAILVRNGMWNYYYSTLNTRFSPSFYNP
jgi:hypothetical protein